MANLAVKKRIKLPSFRVENFCRFLYRRLLLSSPSFSHGPFHPASFFQDLPTGSDSISILSTGWSIDIEPRCRFALPFSSTLRLPPTEFRIFSCFPRASLVFSCFASVCKTPFTASYPFCLPSRACGFRASQLKGHHRKFSGRFSYILL